MSNTTFYNVQHKVNATYCFNTNIVPNKIGAAKFIVYWWFVVYWWLVHIWLHIQVAMTCNNIRTR